MDLDSIAAELYAGSREEFTGRRNELAAEARKAGDRDLAARIKELRKPTSAAWLTNRLVTAHPDEVEELTELGGSLRQAHRDLASDDIRELSHRRREQINHMLGLAREVARSEGVAMSESITREIESSLEAAVAGEEAAAQLAAAQLSTALTPDMTDMWLMAATASPPKDREKPKPKPEKKSKKAPVHDELAAKRAEAERRRQEERQHAEERAKRTAAERDAAERELAELEEEAEELGTRVENLETELAKLKQKHREVRKAAAAAEKALEKATSAAGAADRALSSLR
ncbi:hypothetical protein [Amycolatopsis magusensis]|uniref:Chromosome segregation ATPase n=1 Tax=Amycolatopsis magusensis TaxID=882444 RepID=A0ABS4Q1J8_9PSEU|nr:hypothetical protein [Amycolatopsis magusensis]MBP2185015.1 chromosome segregation ATPase [Amycolatopsis magusensis]MDI5982172.1 hypothetical protein [Amycolatopsis magusensis]